MKHPVRISLQMLARTGRWMNDSLPVLYDCADAFLLLFSPWFIVLLLYCFYSSLLLWEIH